MIVIACLYLTVGVGGFAVHFKDLRAPDGVWIELTEFVAIICGAFLLRAQKWGSLARHRMDGLSRRDKFWRVTRGRNS